MEPPAICPGWTDCDMDREPGRRHDCGKDHMNGNWERCLSVECPMKQFLRGAPFAPPFFVISPTSREDVSSKKDYLIFDLDGVVCHISPERQRLYDTQQYDLHNALGCEEPPSAPMVHLAQRAVANGMEVFVCTSRDGCYAGRTYLQLKGFGFPFRGLLMRGPADHKSSSAQLKSEMYDMIQRLFPRWRCHMAIDDRKDIIALWIKLGVLGVHYAA